MSGVSVPPAKLSLRRRVRERLRPSSSPSSSSSLLTHPSTSSTAQSPGSSSTQILALSNPPSTGLITANSPHSSAPPSSAQQATSNPSFSHNLLDNALKRLSDRDRVTLQDHNLPNSCDIDLALKHALNAAEEKQRCCVEKRWTFTFAGRAVTLQDEADKVVRWLNRFKAVGDVAVNADPLHAGLLWAGIRFLLEVRAVSPKLKPTNLKLKSTGCRL
jgi:hypothetical protein